MAADIEQSPFNPLSGALLLSARQNQRCAREHVAIISFLRPIFNVNAAEAADSFVVVASLGHKCFNINHFPPSVIASLRPPGKMETLLKQFGLNSALSVGTPFAPAKVTPRLISSAFDPLA
jgi:hypothetical protein